MNESEVTSITLKNKSTKSGWKRFKKVYSTQISIFIVLIVLCTLASIFSPYFLTSANFANIGTSMSVTGTIAAGLTVVMLMGGLDLSQMAAMATSVMVMGIMLSSSMNPYVAILTAIFIGAASGVINGVLVTSLKIIPMIATIGTQMIFRAIAYITTGGRYIRLTDKVFNYIGYNSILGIPILLYVMIIVYAVTFFLLRYTKLGREIYAIGSNPTAAYLSGLKINKVKMIGYIFCGATSGIAAILWSSQMSTAIPTAGQGSEMIPVAAVVMGGISLSGGKGNIFGTLVGVALLTVFSNVMVLMNIGSYYQQLLNGVVLIAAVLIDALRSNTKV